MASGQAAPSQTMNSKPAKDQTTPDAVVAANAGLSSQPDPADWQWRNEAFSDQKKQIWTDIQSSSDNYDKSILTLSSGALALSLGFMKDVVQLKSAAHLWLLFGGWVGFVVAIVLTVLSFRFSIFAQMDQLEKARQFYLENNQDAAKQDAKYSAALNICAWGGGICFVAGFILNGLFVALNILKVVRN